MVTIEQIVTNAMKRAVAQTIVGKTLLSHEKVLPYVNGRVEVRKLNTKHNRAQYRVTMYSNEDNSYYDAVYAEYSPLKVARLRGVDFHPAE